MSHVPQSAPIDIYEKPAVLAIDEERISAGARELRIGVEHFVGDAVAAHTIEGLPPQGEVAVQLLWENDW